MTSDNEFQDQLRDYLLYAEDSKQNDHLFYAWEWIMDLSRKNPEAAWRAYGQLVERASDHALEMIGCGPLLDFLWLNPSYEQRFIELAHSNPRFYKAAKWCSWDPDDTDERIEEFARRIESSPFAGQDDA